MTFPEDAVLRRPAAPAKAPSQALGFFLNFFLPGAGFSLIGRWGWHLGWFGILAALNVVVAILSLISSSPLLLLLPLIGFIVMHVHFARIYDWHEERGVWPPLESVLKAVLIAGHFFVGFILTGILAAVLIPNLLGARERAMQVGEQATARNVYARVMVQDVDKTLRSGPCDLHELPESSRATLAACTATVREGKDPAVTLTFDTGHKISLP